MMTCKDISKLVSDSLDRELPIRLRMGLRLHLMMCGLCRTYYKRTRAMQSFIHASELNPALEYVLPDAVAERIQKALDEASS